MLLERLSAEISHFQSEGWSAELIEAEGWVNLVIQNYPLPLGYNKKAITLLVKLPLSYPNGRPDMFWIDPDVTLADGRTPRSAESIETALGKQWRRFSWHPQNWNPANDNLRTYLEFINTRLAKAE